MDKMLAERERLFRVEREELEGKLASMKQERDKMKQGAQQREAEVARLTSERDKLLESLKSEDQAAALVARELEFDAERAGLKQEITKLTTELETLKRTGSTLGLQVEDLDVQILKSSLEEATLERDVLSKENDGLQDEVKKLRVRVEELNTVESSLRTQVEELSSSLKLATQSKSRSFFSRAPAAVPTSPMITTNGSLDNASLRADTLATKLNEVEAELTQVKKQKDTLLEKMMHVANESNTKEVELKKQKRMINDLNEKIEAMSLLAEQTSAIKIKLARRLDSLVVENHTLTQSLDEAKDQLAAMQEVSRVLNEELQRTQQDSQQNGSS